MKTVSALFDTLAEAQLSTVDLTKSGFDPGDINLLAHAGDADESARVNEADQMHDVTKEVTEAGTAVGGLGGLAVGLTLFFVPGIGPLLAAGGLLASLVAGVGLGTLAGGLVGTLAGLGVPPEQAETYAEGIRRGGSLVVVRTADELAATAGDILRRHNPVDLVIRISRWKQTGWDRYEPAAPPYTLEQIKDERGLTSPR